MNAADIACIKGSSRMSIVAKDQAVLEISYADHELIFGRAAEDIAFRRGTATTPRVAKDHAKLESSCEQKSRIIGSA